MKNPSFDLNTRTLDFENEKVTVNYVSSLCSDDLIAYLVAFVAANAPCINE